MIHNYIKVTLQGLNLDRVFKLLKRHKIPLKHIQKVNHKETNFYIQNKNKTKFEELLKDYNYKVHIENRYGVSFLVHFVKTRLGVLIGMFLCLFLVFFLNSFVWNIQVYGLEELSKTQIVTTLEEIGIRTGKQMSHEKISEAEHYLQTKLDKISMISMVKKGTSLLINLKETRIPSVLTVEANNLTSSYEGVITKVNVIQGTPLVKVGDVVKVGDTLIAGYFNTIDGVKTECPAIGEVYAKVWYSSSVIFHTEELKQVRTGVKKEVSSLSLGKNNFKINKTNISYENYEVETKSEYLFYNNFIPLKINKTIYWETKGQLVTQDFEENKNNLVNEALLLAKDKVPSELTSQKEFTTIEKNGTIYVVSAFIECELMI